MSDAAANNDAATAPEPEAEPEPEPESPVMDSFDMHLLTVKECFVYAVPRLATATGYRAEDWGLAHPVS